MRPTPLFVSIASVLAVASADALAAEPASHPINPEAPWALELDDELSKPLVEQWYGTDVAQQWRTIEPHWEEDGTMLLTRDSYDENMLAALGVPPVPAMNYEPAPGVVFVAMDGVTLRPTCGNGDSAHSALNCTPLVNAETTFAAFGAQAASEYQQLRNYYEPFDLVMTSARPPDFIPYTMTVIGGSAAQVGVPGACGIANVACDGLKRNHVSLNFPQSCNGMAETAGQETAHNWGLEHTDNQNDLLYPYNNGGTKSFIDECMNISHATGNGITQCGYIHEIYCPAGGGEQQNSYGEMMGVFGPKAEDTTPPVIVSTFPEDGAVMGTDETFTVTATIEEDSRMVAVKWTWVDGLPEGTDSYTRCTNNVCDNDFVPGPSFVAAEIPWDFVTFEEAPEGTYTFLLEAYDAYSNYDSQMITIQIVEGGGSAEGGVDESGGGSEGDTGDGPGGTGGGEGDTGDGTAGDAGLDGGGDGGGGGCRTAQPRPTSAWMLALLALAGLRRRRAA